MKIIYLTDIHGSFERLKNLLNETIADIYIIGGDLLDIPFYNIETAIRYNELQDFFAKLKAVCGSKNQNLDEFIETILDSPDTSSEIQEKVVRYQHYTIRARRVMQQKYKLLENIFSDKKSAKIFCIPGNYDMNLKYTSLKRRDLHLNSVIIGNLTIAGYGGADILTPGFPEKYIVKYNAKKEMKEGENEMLAFFKKTNPDIIVTHQPAYGIHDRVISFGPTGSPALRSYCDNNNVSLCLTGHIHNDWGLRVSEGTVYLNPSHFGEITAKSGEVLEGGSFYSIEIEDDSIVQIILRKFVKNRIYDIVQHYREDKTLNEKIIDPERLLALKKNENFDTTIVKYSHVPEINLYNDIKEFFRKFQTQETEERIEKLEEIAGLFQDGIGEMAMDIAGSVNMGLSQPGSDIDIVLYLICETPCEEDWSGCRHYTKAKENISSRLKGKYKFEIIDCIDLGLVKKCVEEKNYECDAAQRFVAYRAMFRPINYKLISPVEDKLNSDPEFRKELEGSVRSYLRILANTSNHIKSFQKYKARLNSLGINIPRSITGKIQEYLQVKELK